MLGANKILRYKKIVSLLLLIFCFALAGLTTIGLILNLTPNNIAILRTTAGVVKFELTDNITKEDDTIDKLSQKIKISGSGNKGSLGRLVKVTNSNVMFDYKLNNQTYYFSTKDNNIRTIAATQYAAKSGEIKIPDSMTLATFRDSVNNGNTYSGTTIVLTKDINLGGINWQSIGYGGNVFSGVFDGKNKQISNCSIKYETTGDIDKILDSILPSGLFGNVSGATIKNLKISSVRNEIARLQDSILIGQAENSTISNCSVYENCLIKGRTDNSSRVVGGIIAVATNTNIEKCSSSAQIQINGSNKELNVCAGGIAAWVSGNCTISDCQSSSNISIVLYSNESDSSSSMIAVGGLIGCNTNGNNNYKSEINKCVFNGKLNVQSSLKLIKLQMAGIIAETGIRTNINNCVVNISDFFLGKTSFVDSNIKEIKKSGYDTKYLINLGGVGANIYPIFAGHYYETKHEWVTWNLIITSTDKETGRDLVMKTGGYWKSISDLNGGSGHGPYEVLETENVEINMSECYYKGSSSCMNSDFANYGTRLSV